MRRPSNAEGFPGEWGLLRFYPNVAGCVGGAVSGVGLAIPSKFWKGALSLVASQLAHVVMYLSGVFVLLVMMSSILRNCSIWANHSSIVGEAVERQCRGITNLAAVNIYLIKSLFMEGIEPGRIERSVTCGVFGSAVPVTISYTSRTEFQKVLILGHCHQVCRYEPMALLHLQQISGVLLSYLWMSAGHLYHREVIL